MGSTLQQMRSSIRQLIAVALAITISVGFVATVLQVGGVIKQSTWDAIAAQYNGADAIVTSPNYAPLTATTVDKVRGVSGVASAEGRLIANASLVNGKRAVFPTIAAIPDAPAMRDAIRLDEGRLPSAPGEIVILKDMTKQLQATVGTQAMLNSFDTGITTQVTIVGIIDGTTQFAGPNTPQLYALSSDVKTWAVEENFNSILVTANAETNPSTVIKRVQEALSSDYAVRSRNQQADEMLRSVTDGIDILTFGLLGFAIVALFVAGLVITNTFAILVAQRTRQLALLRCVGATRAQVKRGVMTEAIVLSIVASLTGLLLGIGVIQAGVRLVDRTWPTWGIATHPALNNQLLILPLVLGIAATVFAAWGPARRATRVAPLAALRPEQPEVFRSPVTLRRLIVTLMLISSGGLTMLGGIALSLADPGWIPLLVSIFGGMVSFLGVLVGAVIVVPRVVSLMGVSVGKIGGAAAQIAASNANRNPRRTTATAAALLVAVTLVTMMSVGAESAKSTINREIDQRSPVDLIIGTVSQNSPTDPDLWIYSPLPSTVETVLSSNDDIATYIPVGQTSGTVNDQSLDIYSVDPKTIASVTRSTRGLDHFEDGVALVTDDLANNFGFANGDDVTVQIGKQRLTLTAQIADLPNYGVVITTTDAQKLDPSIPNAQFWARLTDDADPSKTMSSIQDALGGVTDLWYTGGAQDRAANTGVLTTLLWIVTGLLGVAIVISLVGVSNTLSLSVLERTRESAILRALGLTKRQLRAMLALEGVLLALVGAVIGIVLGTIYGFAGAQALIGGTWQVSYAAPFGRMAIIVLIAIAAGVLASVLPARTALKTSPVAALAE